MKKLCDEEIYLKLSLLDLLLLLLIDSTVINGFSDHAHESLFCKHNKRNRD
jgi:hypothetical protein